MTSPEAPRRQGAATLIAFNTESGHGVGVSKLVKRRRFSHLSTSTPPLCGTHSPHGVLGHEHEAPVHLGAGLDVGGDAVGDLLEQLIALGLLALLAGKDEAQVHNFVEEEGGAGRVDLPEHPAFLEPTHGENGALKLGEPHTFPGDALTKKLEFRTCSSMYCAGNVLRTLVVVQRLYCSMRAAAGRQMSVRPLSTWVWRRCI